MEPFDGEIEELIDRAHNLLQINNPEEAPGGIGTGRAKSPIMAGYSYFAAALMASWNAWTKQLTKFYQPRTKPG